MLSFEPIDTTLDAQQAEHLDSAYEEAGELFDRCATLIDAANPAKAFADNENESNEPQDTEEGAEIDASGESSQPKKADEVVSEVESVDSSVEVAE